MDFTVGNDFDPILAYVVRYAMEFYLSMKENEICRKYLELGTILHKITLTQKDKYCVFSPMCLSECLLFTDVY